MLLTSYFSEFVTVLTITLLAIITPGPDFIIVARNSLTYSRRSGVFTALGVGSAIWVHVLYTLGGIGLILSKSIILFSFVKYLGAIYLVYLGWGCIRSSHFESENYGKESGKYNISDLVSFKTGFINNALNPKATLFFLSLFTQVVSHETPILIQVAYGTTVSVSCIVWFSIVAVFLNQIRIRSMFESAQFYIEKIMGGIFIAFGIKVALTSE